MPISVTCFSCFTKLKAPDHAAGKSLKCPTCAATGGNVPVIVTSTPQRSEAPAIVPVIFNLPSGSSRSGEIKQCPFCSEEIHAAAKKCKHCGETIDVPQISFHCPHCKVKLEVTAQQVGTKMLCPDCRHYLTVPAAVPDVAVLTDEEQRLKRRQRRRERALEDAIPIDVRRKMMKDEEATLFEDVSFGGGCAGGSGSKEAWILVTNQRVLYLANIVGNDSGVTTNEIQSGSIPISKISLIRTSSSKSSETVPFHVLSISSGGGFIAIKVPTQKDAERIEWYINEAVAAREQLS